MVHNAVMLYRWSMWLPISLFLGMAIQVSANAPAPVLLPIPVPAYIAGNGYPPGDAHSFASIFPLKIDDLTSKWGYIDSTGREIIKPKWNNVTYFSKQQVIRVRKTIDVAPSKCGLLDTTGKVLVEPTWAQIDNFQDDVARISALLSRK